MMLTATEARRARPPAPRSRRPRCHRGFTLLEVLAAISLLAIAFAIALGTLGKAVQNATRSAALDTALERAQTLLAEQGLTGPLQNATLSGKFDDGSTWTLTIHALPKAPVPADATAARPVPQTGPMLAQAAAIDLYQLDVAVQYGAGRTLRLSTQRAQAGQAGGSP